MAHGLNCFAACRNPRLGIEPMSPALAGDSLPLSHWESSGTASDDTRESVFIFITINGLISIDFFGKVV